MQKSKVLHQRRCRCEPAEEAQAHPHFTDFKLSNFRDIVLTKHHVSIAPHN